MTVYKENSGEQWRVLEDYYLRQYKNEIEINNQKVLEKLKEVKEVIVEVICIEERFLNTLSSW